MAQDWLKVEKSTPEKPKVLRIAKTLGLDPDAVFGKLFRIWSYYDTHTVDGNAPGVTHSFLDARAGIPGFVAALIDAGWMDEADGELSVVNFEQHMGESAKARALAAERSQKSRGRRASESNAPTVTDVTRQPLPDKSRVEDIPPVVPPRGDGLPAALETAVGQTVRRIWYPEPMTSSHVRSALRWVKDFETLGATPMDIELRHGVAVREWGAVKATPAAVVRRWVTLIPPPPASARVTIPYWLMEEPAVLSWCSANADALAGVGDVQARYFLYLHVEGKRGRFAAGDERDTAVEYWHMLHAKFGDLEGDGNPCAGYLREAFRAIEVKQPDAVPATLAEAAAAYAAEADPVDKAEAEADGDAEREAAARAADEANEDNPF